MIVNNGINIKSCANCRYTQIIFIKWSLYILKLSDMEIMFQIFFVEVDCDNIQLQ